MDRIQQALGYFAEGYSCSQAIFRSYAPGYGISEVDALRIASGFGGGMQRGDVCGALTGALMVLGLHYGPREVDDIAAKKVAGEKVVQCCKRFQSRCGSMQCRDLLGCDLGTEAGRTEFQQKGLSKRVCPQWVRVAAELLEEMC